tara:strand:+ start:345 stop:2210 length:1866 start_codon:yes stop_codon:yes gene_type:complete
MYQDGGTLMDAAKSYEPKAMIYAEGVRRSSELANAINITSRLFSEGTNPKDVAKMLFATASLESDFGTTTQKNHFQIDPPAYKRVFGKNDKGNYTSKQKEYFAKIEALTGLKAKDITHEQVKNNPLLSAITARLYYTKSPNAIPTNAQDFANEYVGHYNAGGAQKYQSEEYTKKKAQERFMQASMAIDKMFEDNPGPVANPQERKVTGPAGDTIKFQRGGNIASPPPPPPPPPPTDPIGDREIEDLDTSLVGGIGTSTAGNTGISTTTTTEAGLGLTEQETGDSTAVIDNSGETGTELDVLADLEENNPIDTAVDVNITDNLTDYIDYLEDIEINPPDDDDDDDDDDDGNDDVGPTEIITLEEAGGGTGTTTTTTDTTDTATDIGISLEEAETGGGQPDTGGGSLPDTGGGVETTNTDREIDIIEGGLGGGTLLSASGEITDVSTGGGTETENPDRDINVTIGGLGEGEAWYNQGTETENPDRGPMTDLGDGGDGRPDTEGGVEAEGGLDRETPEIGPQNPIGTDSTGNPFLREPGLRPDEYIDPSTVQSGLGTQGVRGVYGGRGGGTGTIKGIRRGRRGMGSFGGGFLVRQEDDDKVNIFQAAGDIYSSLLRREMKKNKR